MSLAIGGLGAFMLIRWLPNEPAALPNRFSFAFTISTCLLFLGSGCMHMAVLMVRRERQRLFRRWLKLALAMGVLFVATQTYALTCLIRQQPSEDASSGAAAMVAVFGFLHGMHIVIAMLFLSYIMVQTSGDRYDHEYNFGVRFTAWFWHALGLVWIAILGVMFIARVFSE